LTNKLFYFLRLLTALCSISFDCFIIMLVKWLVYCLLYFAIWPLFTGSASTLFRWCGKLAHLCRIY